MAARTQAPLVAGSEAGADASPPKNWNKLWCRLAGAEAPAGAPFYTSDSPDCAFGPRHRASRQMLDPDPACRR